MLLATSMRTRTVKQVRRSVTGLFLTLWAGLVTAGFAASSTPRLHITFTSGGTIETPGVRLAPRLWAFSLDLSEVPSQIELEQGGSMRPVTSASVDSATGILVMASSQETPETPVPEWSESGDAAKWRLPGSEGDTLSIVAIRTPPGVGEIVEVEVPGSEVPAGPLLDVADRVAALPIARSSQGQSLLAVPAGYLQDLALESTNRWPWPGTAEPKSWRGYQVALRALFTGHPAEALAALDRLDPARFPGPELAVLRSRVLAEAGRREESIAVLASVLKAHPGHRGAAAVAGLLFFSVGGYRRAAEFCQQVLAVRPRQAECHAVAGTYDLSVEDYSDALQHFEKLVRFSVSPARAAYGHLGMGSALAGLERRGEAGRAFARSSAALKHWKRNPMLGDDRFGDTRTLELSLGLAQARNFARLSRWTEAIDHFRATLEAEPSMGSSEVLVEYAEALTRVGRWQDAEPVLKEATARFPDYAPAFHWLGVVYAWAGRWQDAFHALNRAQALRPNHPETLYHMALCLLQLDRYQEAAEIHQQLKTRSPELAAQLARQLQRPPRSP